MADEKIKLGLDLGDSTQKAKELASSLEEIRDSAQELKAAASPLDDSLAMLDAGLVGLVPDAETATAKTTEFAESLRRLDAVLKSVDDIETVFGPGVADPRAATNTYEVLADAAMRTRTQNKELAESTKEVAKSYQLLAGAGANYARLQEVEAASDRAVAAAVAQTRAQAALREVLSDIPPAFTRTIGVVKGSGEAMAAASKASGAFGQSVLSTSYAIQDFTSVLGTQGLMGSLRAVQNNIPIMVNQFATAGGMTVAQAAAIAGGISIVSVGAGLLYENWDKLVGLLSSTESKLPTLKEGLEGLAGSLKGIAKEIEELDEKAESSVLSHPEKLRLKELQRLQAQGRQQTDDLKLVEGVKAEVSDQQKALMEAVKKAVAAAGGGEAVADALRFQTGGKYEDAAATVAGAMRGNKDDLAAIRQNLPSFDSKFKQVDPAVVAENLAAQKRGQEDLKRGQAMLRERDERERRAKARVSRRAGQDEEIRQAEQSTPEELRQSEALQYLDNFTRKNAPGLQLDNKDQVAISESMMRGRDAGLSAKDATIRAVRDFLEKQQGVQDDSVKNQLESEFARFAGNQGFSLNAQQVADAAQSVFKAMQNQVGKDDAAIMALRELAQANAELSGQVAAQKQMFNQVRANARTTRTRLNRGR